MVRGSGSRLAGARTDPIVAKEKADFLRSGFRPVRTMHDVGVYRGGKIGAYRARIGIRRAGHPREDSKALNDAYRMFCQQRKSQDAVLAWLKEQPGNHLLDAWIAFLSSPSKSGYARARPGRKSGGVEEEDV